MDWLCLGLSLEMILLWVSKIFLGSQRFCLGSVPYSRMKRHKDFYCLVFQLKRRKITSAWILGCSIWKHCFGVVRADQKVLFSWLFVWFYNSWCNCLWWSLFPWSVDFSNLFCLEFALSEFALSCERGVSKCSIKNVINQKTISQKKMLFSEKAKEKRKN